MRRAILWILGILVVAALHWGARDVVSGESSSSGRVAGHSQTHR